MGSRIAAHLTNAGYPVELLDIVLPNQAKRSQAAIAGIESAARAKPGSLAHEPGLFEEAPPDPPRRSSRKHK